MPAPDVCVSIHLLPPADGLPTGDAIAVVVDVLRASTTIATALSAGAAFVRPCLTVEEAQAAATAEDLWLGGERGGVRLPGFDFGNSPLEYTPQALAGRGGAFTTTNGTRALHACRRRQHVIVAAFVNLTSAVDFCLQRGESVDIVCAGTDGVVSAEDVLFAGFMACRLQQHGLAVANDVTRIAMDFSRLNTENPTRLLECVRQSQGGRNLIQLGYDHDLEFAATADRFTIVPVCDHSRGVIHAA